MKLESFFEKFDQFADAPDAVAKMRELILQLAVIGKLCPQDSSEEPASALLAKIAGTNKSRYASGEIRLRENARVSEDLEVSVPDGWSSVALGEIADVNWGNTSLTKKSYSESGFTAYSATGPDGWIDHAEFSGPGIVLSAIGARSGKCFLAEGQWTAIKNTITIIPFSPISNDWLFRAINRESAWKKRGGAQPFIALKDAISLPLLLPPLAEQKRIVAKVDELMALCDRLEAQQQERETRHAALARASLARFADAPTPANLNLIFHSSYSIPPADLRKSILTLAVQGKLVPQDPNDEPAEELLETIAKQRAKLLGSDSLRKTKPCRQFTSDEAPNEIPETWAWTMLGEVTDIGTGSTPSRTEASFWIDGTIPWITSGSTSRSPITEGDELVTPAAVKAHRLRVYPPGTLLVALYGQGKTRGQVAALEIAATINQACAAICPLDGIPPMQGYLKLLLEKQYDEMRSLSAGGAQPNLNVQKIKEVFVPLPPLSEQRRIVAKVDQLMALVDQLETQLTESRAIAQSLMEAVVAQLTQEN